MSFTKQQVIQSLSQVRHPSDGDPLPQSGRLANVAVCEGVVRLTLHADELSPADRQTLSDNIRQAVGRLGSQVRQVIVDYEQAPGRPSGAEAPPKGARPGQSPPSASPLPDVEHVIAVGAGKGGVGKSTIAVNLAVGLGRKGLNVGLLDGDIYGPSVPTLLGLEQYEQTGTNDRLLPIAVAGIRAITIGKLVDAEKPLIWRGPMAHGAFSQLLKQTDWGKLDYLIVDLPPGTGDVPLSLAQMIPLTGAVIICTPQRLAQDDARRAVAMFRQLDVTVLGVVENMSYFVGDDGKQYDIFGRGGAEQMANELTLPLLGTIPINMALRHHCDTGQPLKNFQPGTALAAELENLVDNLHQTVLQHQQARAAHSPTLHIH